MRDLEREVAAIVGQIVKVPADQISPETDLRLDLHVDSLQGLQIVAALEKRFGVTVPPEEIDLYSSTRAIVATLEPLLRRAAPSAAVPPFGDKRS